MRRAGDGRWRTRFGSWVGRYTVKRIAAEMAARGDPITVKACYGWLSGMTVPRAERAMAMVKISGGRIRLEDVFRHRLEVRHARERLSPAGESPSRPLQQPENDLTAQVSIGRSRYYPLGPTAQPPDTASAVATAVDAVAHAWQSSEPRLASYSRQTRPVRRSIFAP